MTASVALVCSPGSSSFGASSSLGSPAMLGQWSGVLELRSSSGNIHEFIKSPQDALHVLCGSAHVQIATDSSTMTMTDLQISRTESQSASASMRTGSQATSNPGATFSSSMDFPGTDFTTDTSRGSGGGRANSSGKWTPSPFDQSFDAPDQLRPVSAASTSDDPWGM